jgi:two-component system response regulator RegA
MTAGRRVLLVDDDDIFRSMLSKSFARRGYEVANADGVEAAMALVETFHPDFAIVDLRMPGSSGLKLVDHLCRRDPSVRIVVLTGYGSISTAKEAIRLGAVDYLTKPADTEEILSALMGQSREPGEAEALVPSLERVEWEHIQRVLADCDGNVSKAARVLGIHRRSLQRKLGKFPPRT